MREMRFGVGQRIGGNHHLEKTLKLVGVKQEDTRHWARWKSLVEIGFLTNICYLYRTRWTGWETSLCHNNNLRLNTTLPSTMILLAIVNLSQFY